MDKRDWKEAKRREKTVAAGAKTQTLGDSASSSPQPHSSSSGAHTQTGMEDPEANAYHPEMDEMRCLLRARGGLDPCPLRWYTFRSNGTPRVPNLLFFAQQHCLKCRSRDPDDVTTRPSQ